MLQHKRKYLLTRDWEPLINLLSNDQWFKRSTIHQVYINRRTRLDRITSGGETTYFHTTKHEIPKKGQVVKVQLPLSHTEFDLLAKKEGGQEVRKLRYTTVIDAVTWTVDFLRDAEDKPYLVFAEAELAGDADPQRIVIPNWLTPFIDREIPRDKLKSYSNSLLASPKQAGRALKKLAT